MNLGFYYHIPIYSSSEGLKIPAYLGVFLDSLAKEVDSLLLFMHEANELEISQCDYVVSSDNIHYVSLGLKTPAWDRFLWPGKTLKKISGKVLECDALLVRAPSPLAPGFFNKYSRLTNVAYLVVGDYVEGVKHLYQPWWRKLAIISLSINNDRQLRSVIGKTLTLVNSSELYRKYYSLAPRLYEVKTTTLLSTDFYFRENTCLNSQIKILYTGVLSLAKGLVELIEAVAILLQDSQNISLHLVGREYSTKTNVEEILRKKAITLGIETNVFFHGYRRKGEELNEIYRKSDIYVIPSFYEGFPRTIWEAMANSLPVIATTVGSIPYYLKDHVNVMLISPHKVSEIVGAIREVSTHSDLRKKLIANGFALARENTLNIQNKRIAELLQNFVNSNKET